MSVRFKMQILVFQVHVLLEQISWMERQIGNCESLLLVLKDYLP